jgi:hypothetical protein
VWLAASVTSVSRFQDLINESQVKQRRFGHALPRCKSLVGVSGVKVESEFVLYGWTFFFLLLLNSLLDGSFPLKDCMLLRHYIECPVTCFMLHGKPRDLASMWGNNK